MGIHHKAEKKRKRASEKPDRPSKKPALAAPVVPAVKVQFVQNTNGAVPVIASTPGISIPSSIPLTAYSRPRQNRQKHKTTTNTTLSTSEILLQSSAHPRIDFLGKEGENELDTLWNHYVAVYDPDAGKLELVEARKMTVRGCVRRVARKAINDGESDGDVVTKSNWAQRTALTEAFGTKQSRKAIQSIAENALLSNAPAGSGPTPAESALLSSIPKEHTSTSVSGSPQKSAQSEIQAAKPLPQPNLSATHPSQVYAIDTLVPNGLSTLRTMPVHEWQAAIGAGEPVLSSSRFVAHRVNHVVRSGDVTQLQLLRYIMILIELSRSLKPSRGAGSAAVAAGSKKLPPREDLRRILSSSSSSSSSAAATAAAVTNKQTHLPDSFLDALRRKFVPQRTFLSKTDITFLHTTICALSLHIPPEAGFAPNELATDPADLRDDLSLEYQTIQQYFRELGCKVEKPRESEFAKWGVRSKVEAGARRIARLRVPVEFPKVSRGGRR
ncbi:hypothetical protein BDFG_06790 [Blastomyces dermatitidis ATCC 26199]|nr:hypothetical protein BDFG_06790 [Blastomyces dermatitidis ATCC 26199]